MFAVETRVEVVWPAVLSDHHAGVLDLTVWEQQLGADGGDLGVRLARHAPARRASRPWGSCRC